MAWVKASLRGQQVYARATDQGAFVAVNGRVEIRYKPNDGRRYDARADNLTVVDGKVLPDETCAEAQPVAKDAKETNGAASGKGGKTSAKSKSSAPGKARDGEIIAYADGACSGNPGPAGLGVVLLLAPDKRIELSEYLGTGTNNIAELTAILRALGEVDPKTPFVIFTDSQYSIGILQKGWKAKANQELIAKVRAELEGREATRIAYVPGHSGVPLNERADELAREAVTNRATRRAVYEKP